MWHGGDLLEDRSGHNQCGCIGDTDPEQSRNSQQQKHQNTDPHFSDSFKQKHEAVSDFHQQGRSECKHQNQHHQPTPEPEQAFGRNQRNHHHHHHQQQQQQRHQYFNHNHRDQFNEQQRMRNGGFRDQNTHHSRQQYQQPQVMPTPFAEVDVSGYKSNEIEVWTEGNKVVVKGHRKCACDESCLVQEFQRTYNMPRGLDSKSVKAKFGRNGKLTLQGLVTNAQSQISDNKKIEVDYQGPKESVRENVDCPKKNAGIPLKKVQVKKGKYMNTVKADTRDKTSRFEGEMEDDGVTIEVVE